VKRAIRAVDLSAAKQLAAEALGKATAKEVREFVDRRA
jgi:hypothetical protein